MSLKEQPSESLFSYGTLQSEDVQLETFGRKLEGRADALPGYRLVMIKITDEDFVAKSGTADHRSLHYTGNSSDFVEGTVFKVTRNELELVDAYEPEGYNRVKTHLKSGGDTWVYIYQGNG
jgi:AIG2-like family.